MAGRRDKPHGGKKPAVSGHSPRRKSWRKPVKPGGSGRASGTGRSGRLRPISPSLFDDFWPER